MIKENKDKFILGFMLLGIFTFFFIFFTNIHPIVLSDTDDWGCMLPFRDAIPQFGAWNPTRVFPEILMPFLAAIAGYVFYPLFPSAGLFRCLTCVFAFTVAIAFTWLTYQIVKILRVKKIHFSDICFIVLFFVVSHFWIFRSNYSWNLYMLHTKDMCTYFYYVVPNLLSCALVLYLFRMKQTNAGGGIRSSIICLIYLCIFSNIWASIVVAVYVGTVLIYGLSVDIKTKKYKLSHFIKTNGTYCVILLLWIVEQILELTGGRARSINNAIGISSLISETVIKLWKTFSQINLAFFICGSALIIITVIIISIKKNKVVFNYLLFAFVNMLVVLAYDVLSCAKVGSEYIQRPDVIYGAFFWLMIILMICISTIASQINAIRKCYVIAFVLIVANCDRVSKTYQESIVSISEPEIAYNICEDIAYQMQLADKSGEDSIILHVPDFGVDGNWPYATYANNYISNFCYKYGLTVRRIGITEIVPTQEKNNLLKGVIENDQ